MNEIETKFSETLNAVLERGFIIVQDQRLEVEQAEEYYYIRFNNKLLEFTISVQSKDEIFEGYIPDFAIYINNLVSGFVIEIDGHEWHEKTKEQVRADKEKDRAYLKNGFIPIRFAGSEVYHNAKRCVDELLEIMILNYDKFDYDNLNIQNYMLFSDKEEIEKKLHNVCFSTGTIKAFNFVKGQDGKKYIIMRSEANIIKYKN